MTTTYEGVGMVARREFADAGEVLSTALAIALLAGDLGCNRTIKAWRCHHCLFNNDRGTSHVCQALFDNLLTFLRRWLNIVYGERYD